MREPPAGLSLDTLGAAVQDQYGVRVREMAFLPLGHDPAAWVYRVEAADSSVYFLKACLRIRNEAGLRVPRYLQEHGVRNVVAPLPAADGTLWAHADGYALVLYPFVEGQNGMQQRLTPRQWIEYGRALRQLHDLEVTPDLARIVQRDLFQPTGADLVRRLDHHLCGTALPDDEPQKLLAQFWRQRRATILTLLERAEMLGRRLAERAPPLVLCHADIHTGNVLAGTDGRVWIVDWDAAILAPRERDLMFPVGGISERLVTPAETELFVQGYCEGYGTLTRGPSDGGQAPTTQSFAPLALAYYRYAWAVSDISAYGESVCFRPDLSPTARHAEAQDFISLFAAGNIVEIALATEVGEGGPAG